MTSCRVRSAVQECRPASIIRCPFTCSPPIPTLATAPVRSRTPKREHNPMFPEMTETQLQQVAAAVNERQSARALC